MSFPSSGSALLASALLLAACAPAGGSATLSWQTPTSNIDGSHLQGLAGYTIYYGRDPKALVHAVRVPDPRLTQYEVHGLGPGTWYFSVAAFTTSGQQSGLAPVTSKFIPADPP